MKHGYLENLDMIDWNETELIIFSAPMWPDVNYIIMKLFS